MNKIKFVDLQAQYNSIRREIDSAVENVLNSSVFINGKNVNEFEMSFRSYLGVNHVIGCANGTDAIEIILQACHIGPGDEVIVPAASWISTAEAVSTLGAIPVFVDIDPLTYTLNPELIEKKISKKAKAVIPVHLYGNPADMVSINLIAQKHNLIVIEDCAQAHGASINGKKVGTFGQASTFSFYPSKNLGAYGDAGAMASDNADIAGTARKIANHGQTEKNKHPMLGRNSRLDELQAAVLNVKLKHLDNWNTQRAAHANHYSELLKNSSVVVPQVRGNSKHVFHLYVILSEKRDELKKFLSEKNIETAVHYPSALPFLDGYANQKHSEKDFPVAAAFTRKILSLPMYPELKADMIEYVSDCIKKFE